MDEPWVYGTLGERQHWVCAMCWGVSEPNQQTGEWSGKDEVKDNHLSEGATKCRKCHSSFSTASKVVMIQSCADVQEHCKIGIAGRNVTVGRKQLLKGTWLKKAHFPHVRLRKVPST